MLESAPVFSNVPPLPDKVFDITITVGVRAPTEEIARFKLQEQTRYMTLVHNYSFVDAKLDIVQERGVNHEVSSGS
jgi:hypothetical protein